MWLISNIVQYCYNLDIYLIVNIAFSGVRCKECHDSFTTVSKQPQLVARKRTNHIAVTRKPISDKVQVSHDVLLLHLTQGTNEEYKQ